MILLIIALGAGTLAFRNGSRAVKAAFDREKEEAEASVYTDFYEQGYDAGEAQYHVANKALISLGEIRETAVLEVLSVSDIVYLIQNPDSENKNVTSWLEVPGSGVFTVNLSVGEFLVDDERQAVYVRLPKPELLPDNITIDHENVKTLLFRSNSLETSIADGERLAMEQMNEARTRIAEEIGGSLQYYEYAEKSARTLLENLIRAINIDISDLKVEIEFY